MPANSLIARAKGPRAAEACFLPPGWRISRCRNQSPFLNLKSFAEQEVAGSANSPARRSQLASPFLAVYEFEDAGGSDPQAEEYVEFLNELYDEHFNEVLTGLADEAASVYETLPESEREEPGDPGRRAERMLTQHFAPLAARAETIIRNVGDELGRRDPDTLSETEVDGIVDRHASPAEFNPQFEEWLGGFLKKIAKKGLGLVKKGVSLAAKLGLGPVLNKLLGLVKPIFRWVIDKAIGRLPASLQPIARTLHDKLPFMKEFEDGEEPERQASEADGVAGIQNELNRGAVDLMFAETETDQDLVVARATRPPGAQGVSPVAELEQARERFIDGLGQLREGEDPTPQVETFLPALLPVLKIGLKLAGRQRVVDFLAGFLGKLIRKFVGSQYAPPLSKAIVDAGLRLLQLETPEGETRAAASAVASTVEETMHRVAALPGYVLDNQNLLEGAVLEAFEQAAANNLPPMLSPDTYRRRPELREHRGGFWFRRGRRYKKRLGPRIMIRISPHRLAELETFDGATVGEALEQQYRACARRRTGGRGAPLRGDAANAACRHRPWRGRHRQARGRRRAQPASSADTGCRRAASGFATHGPRCAIRRNGRPDGS